MQGIIFDIKRYAIHDGPGIRTTVFFKGCPMRCPWCHNPESQKKEPEKIGENEIIGEVKTVQDVMQEIEKDIPFYDESRGGVTFSGGEPLFQPDFLKALLSECKKKEIHTTLDTTGCIEPEIFDSIIDDVDLFFYDIKFMDEKKHFQYTGTSNRSVIENLKSLIKKGKKVIIRFPVIPGITDKEENIKAIGKFIFTFNSIEEIDLLPYHNTAEGKYRRLRRKNKMKELKVKPPTVDRMLEIKNLFYGCIAPHIKVKEG